MHQIHTHSQDVRRVIPFFIILVLVPESLPFLLMRGANIVPSTCMLPEQIIPPNGLAVASSVKRLAAVQHQHFATRSMPRELLVQFSRILGLPTLRPTWMLRAQLDRHMRFLRQDDDLLVAQGIHDLTLEELEAANEARGMPSTGATAEVLSEQLSAWLALHTSTDPPIPPGLMLLSTMVRLASSSQHRKGPETRTE
ncbi:hypothetical protein HK105_206922 [Polyrhizophydium stewartii]|uniref:Letm1 RBD domain-containing protein n=1 Tax=Polyrhizophydium stewartii TaxID=2732419 RepID=A0ABR4N269_9FUNG